MKFIQLKYRKTQKPHVTQIYLYSDEAGCCYNNSLISAAADLGHRVGTTPFRYDCSEPQYGKDEDMTRRYCNEEHDILTAADMRRLQARQGNGQSRRF